MLFDAQQSANEAFIIEDAAPRHVDFRTPADPDAGWAARNPDRAMLFLFVSPRDCAAVDELIAA
jgi:hypothetical protein